MENQIGQMEDCIKDNGKMENKMEKGYLHIIIKQEREFGKMDNQSNGGRVKYYHYNEILSSFKLIYSPFKHNYIN